MVSCDVGTWNISKLSEWLEQIEMWKWLSLDKLIARKYLWIYHDFHMLLICTVLVILTVLTKYMI